MNLIDKLRSMYTNGNGHVRPTLPEALAGDEVECPCCDGTFITFLPFGLIRRSNAFCPACSSLERHRLHWHYMTHKTYLLTADRKQRLLHVAPETVLYNKFSNSDNLDYVPCAKFGEGFPDIYPEGTMNIDITAIGLPDDSFDVIYCSHVLEHIPDDAAAMKELRRVLKPGGWAMLQVPLDESRETTYEDWSIISPLEREQAFGQNDHVRVYGRDYKQRLEAAGFNVNQDKYTEQFTHNELFRYGFLKGEDIFICTK